MSHGKPPRPIGYARVSTEEQSTRRQVDELRAAGVAELVEERASGADRSRPVLARLLRALGPGDTLVVTKLDRLARSLEHLLEVVRGLEARGAFLRVLGDPIDTATPQGRFMLQMLGAVAEFERALIRDRVRSGLARAAREGRRGGHPGLRARDPEAVARLRQARDARHRARLLDGAEAWLPLLVRLRAEGCGWEEAAAGVNRHLSGQGSWSPERLRRAARSLARAGLAPAALLEPRPAPRPPAPPDPDEAVRAVAALLGQTPGMTLRALGAALERLRLRPRRGGAGWAPSSVARLVARARAAGLA
ncbi:recombinase family protein [Roseococcus sp. DSY-14]|uniref:recombinase family protein n=1 Tax=Roseococcus sp. DSY-14 TaxID=3369650 RepID=UPI00387B8DAA